MQQLRAFTHKGQMRNVPQVGPSVLAGDDFLLRAEEAASGSGAKDARCTVLGTRPGHCLRNWSAVSHIIRAMQSCVP
jgi:hypothetical protein